MFGGGGKNNRVTHHRGDIAHNDPQSLFFICAGEKKNMLRRSKYEEIKRTLKSSYVFEICVSRLMCSPRCAVLERATKLYMSSESYSAHDAKNVFDMSKKISLDGIDIMYVTVLN